MSVDVDVVIAGGGPTGLMLACELRLAGVHPVVLERQPEPRDTPKANGLVGQIVQLLDYRGLLARFSEGSRYAGPMPHFQFGSVPVDFTGLGGSPLHALLIPQPRLEQQLGERAAELGVEMRRGHELRALTQDDSGVTLEVHGPDEAYQLRAGYLVGCDGAHSLVREQAGIGFPGTTGTEVTRLGHVKLPDAIRVLETGELEVPGVGRMGPGMGHRTDRGSFAMASFTPGVLLVAATEEGQAPADQDAPMTLEELQGSLRRVVGVDVPLGEPIWLSRTVSQARLAERYRAGRVLLAGDAAHLFPAGGAALNAGLTDTVNLGGKLAAEVHGWAPPGLLDSYHAERRHAGERTMLHARAQAALMAAGDDTAALRELFGELMRYEEPLRHVGELLSGADTRYDMGAGDDTHPLAGRLAPDLPLQGEGAPSRVAELLRQPRGVLLDLMGGAGLDRIAAAWKDRVEVVTAWSGQEPLPAAALLFRPDGYVAWATDPGRPEATVEEELRAALRRWFGAERGGSAR